MPKVTVTFELPEFLREYFVKAVAGFDPFEKPNTLLVDTDSKTNLFVELLSELKLQTERHEETFKNLSEGVARNAV